MKRISKKTNSSSSLTALDLKRMAEVESFIDETYRDSSSGISEITKNGDSWRIKNISSEGYFGDQENFNPSNLHIATAVHVFTFAPHSQETLDVYCDTHESGVPDIFGDELGEVTASIVFGMLERYVLDEEGDFDPSTIKLELIRDSHLRNLIEQANNRRGQTGNAHQQRWR